MADTASTDTRAQRGVIRGSREGSTARPTS